MKTMKLSLPFLWVWLVIKVVALSLMIVGLEQHLQAEDSSSTSMMREAVARSLERIPMCSIEWDVVRVLPEGPVAPSPTPGAPGSLREGEKSAADGKVQPPGKSIPMRIKVDYIDPSHFYIHHEFRYPNGSVEYEYFADGDGVIYGVNHTIKRVRLIKAEKRILQELTRGMPQVQISEVVKNAGKISQARHGDVYSLSGNSPRGGFVANLGAGLAVLNLKIGILKPSANPQIIRVAEEVTVTQQNPDLNCPVPAEVVFRSFKGTGELAMQETWRLVSWSRKATLSDLHTQKYVLRPNFHVDDETGVTVRKFLSNEVLNSNK